MPILSIRLLGSFQVEMAAKTAVHFTSDKVRALLAYLAAETNQPHRRDKLAGLLWPEAPQKTARTNLRRALADLRKAIGDHQANPPYLFISRQTIQFNRESDVWVDVLAFAALLAANTTKQAVTDQTSQQWEEAASLYRGHFLEGFFVDDSLAFEEWALLKRERLQRQAVELLHRLVAYHESGGAYARAVPYAWRQVELDPFQEPAQRQVMRLLALTGQRAAALAQYESLKCLLTDELGIVPAAKTTALYAKILAGDLVARTESGSVRGYELHEQIGVGRYGVVYRAVQPGVRREVAIKVIQPQYANHPDFIRRFEAEAQLVARLEHPYIVPLYDYWREPDGAYLVMRWLQRGSLQGALVNGPFALETAVILIEQIATALDTAHRQGIIHRDVKPANILLDEDGNAFLSDFSIAQDSKQEIDPTQPESPTNTPSTISPERILNKPITPQTDLYNLGLVLYELLTGTHPFATQSLADMVHHCLHEPIPLVQMQRKDILPAIDAVIQQATARLPTDRYPNTLTFAAALRRAAAMNELSRVSATTPVTRTNLVNPYKGLLTFQEADTAVFYGRDSFIAQLLPHLTHANRFLAIIGPSGSGKSSVAKAGLIPALRRGAIVGSEKWFITEMTPGTNPYANLATSLLQIAVNPPTNLPDLLQKDEQGLAQILNQILPADHDGERSQLVLLIDQFEELFTLVTDEQVRVHFMNSLVTALADPHSRLRVVITLRADFYDRPLQYQSIGTLLRHHSEPLLPLNPAELEQAICHPASDLGVEVEPQLIATIAADVQAQPGAMPLLQYALTELFEEREEDVMTLAAYKKIGGIAGALGRRAEELYRDLDRSSQEAARQLFLRLTTFGENGSSAIAAPDTRRRVALAELEAVTTVQPLLRNSSDTSTQSYQSSIINQYGRYRLLTFDRDPTNRTPTVEVAHESLLREWPRLRGWLDESRADLRQQRLLASATVEWLAAEQNEGFLLRNGRLAQFSGWAESSSVALTHQEQAFLAASQTAQHKRQTAEEARRQRELETAKQLAATEKKRAEEQTQANRRLRRRALFLTAALMIVLVLAGVAFWAYQQSVQNEHVAFSRELAATALDNLDTDPELSALLALQGLEEAKTIEAQSALHTALPALHLQRTLVGHTDSIIGMEISPDGERIITASSDKTAKIWDAATGELLMTLVGHEDGLSDPAYSPDGIHVATADEGGVAKVWDGRSGAELLTLSGHTGPITFITYNHDGSRIATASGDATARIWDAFSGEVLLTLEGHEAVASMATGGASGGVIDVKFSPDEKTVATLGGDGTLRIWDAYSGQEQRIIAAHAGAGTIMAFNPDGSQLASAGEDGTVKIWDMAAGEEFGQQLLLINKSTFALAFSPDGKRLATMGLDGPAFIWDVASGQKLLTLFGHTGGGHDVAFTPDGRFLITSSEDTTVKIWDTAPGREIFTLVGPGGIIADAIYSPDGKQIATAEADGSVSLWNSVTGKLMATLPGHDNLTSNIDFSPDGHHLASSSFDGTVKLWDLATQEELMTLAGQNGQLWDVTFSPDGNLVAASGENGIVEIWDSQTGQKLQELVGHEDLVFGIAFSPDDSQMATASWDNTVKVWDLASGHVSHTFSADNDFFDVEFSPDGTRLAASNRNGFVKIWDISAEAVEDVTTLTGHTSGVTRLTFSPDGSVLATASFDGTAKVWQLDNLFAGQELTLAAHTDFLTGVEFSPDGQHLITSSFDGTARVYTLSVDELIFLAQSRLTRTLSNEECQRFLHVEACPNM
ncbi:MAG: protein kinase [Anaerolineales bacterium]|nr:protein kinase [Anaerolineales bacterium]